MIMVEVVSETFDPGVNDVDITQLFSMELRTCVVTEKRIEMNIVKVGNVASFSCMCLKCGMSFAATTTSMASLKGHMKTHYLQTDKTEASADNYDSTAHGSEADSEIVADDSNAISVQAADSVTGPGHNETDAGYSETGMGDSVTRADSRTTDDDGADDIADMIKFDNRPTGHYRAVSADHEADIDNVGADNKAETDDVGIDKSIADNGSDVNGNDGADDRVDIAVLGAVDSELVGSGVLCNQLHPPESAVLTDPCHCTLVSMPDNDTISEFKSDTTEFMKSPDIASTDIPKCKPGTHNLINNRDGRKLVKKEPLSRRIDSSLNCNICGMKLLCQQKLIEHMNVHTGEKPYICSVCGQGFKRKTLLNVHLRKHQEQLLHKCEECDKKFTNARTLKEHQTIHTGEKLFLCTVCGLAFRKNSYLSLHYKKHGEGMHTCSECGKQFTLASKLKDHRTIHTGEKPFLCAICGAQFRCKYRVTEHMRIHTGEKRHTCGICGKSFSRKCYLTVHKLMHGEKSVNCSVCEKIFKHRASMKRHVRKVHKETDPVSVVDQHSVTVIDGSTSLLPSDILKNNFEQMAHT